MCHVSVGHVARAFDEAGIPSVVIMSKVFRNSIEKMNPPRVLLTPHAMGRPLSAPFDVSMQRAVLKAGLEILENAMGGGTLVEYREPYRMGPFDGLV